MGQKNPHKKLVGENLINKTHPQNRIYEIFAFLIKPSSD